MRPHGPVIIAMLALVACSLQPGSPALIRPMTGTSHSAPITDAVAIPGVRELIVDGGFEGPSPGPWVENNWAESEVEFVRDHDRPYRGQSAQRIRLIRALHTASLQLLQPLPGIKPRDAVRVHLATRGLANSRPLEVMLRRIGPPYTDFGHLRLPVTENWQEAGFIAVMPAVLPADLGLYIVLNEENTVWVDEVSVGILPAIDPRPISRGNLIANGSFETGSERWYASLQNDVAPEVSDWLVVDSSDATEGGRVLRFRVREGGSATVNSAWFPYRYGHPLRLSLDLAAEQPGEVAISLGHGEFPNTTWVVQQRVAVGAAWKRCEFTCTPGPSDNGALFLQLACSTPGTYRLDRAVAEQAPAPPVCELGSELIASPPGAIYHPDERPRLRVRAVHAGAGTTIEATATVTDAWATTVAQLPLHLPVGADGAATAEVDLPTGRFGGFRVAVTVGGRLESERIYSLVPLLPPPDGSGRSFFGGHFCLTDYGLAIAERGGFRWLRLHPPLYTKWHVVEPVPGTMRFPTAEIERATRRGFSILGSLDSPPQWAATPGIDFPYQSWHSRVPRDWTAWSAYVQGIIRALPGIHAWEIYNEPDGDFLVVKPGEDKAAAYVAILAHTRQAVEEIGAQVELVGLPVSSLDRPFFREVLAKGGAGSVDALAFHYYYEDLDPLEKHPAFLEQLATMRAARSRSGNEPEIWHTEGGMWLRRSPSWLALSGIASTEGTGELDAAHALVRTAIALKALGVKHHFQYAGLSSPAGRLVYRSECSGLIDVDGSARPALAAHAAMVWLLDDAEPVGVQTMTVGPATVCLARFTAPLGRITVAWSRQTLAASQVPGLLDGSSMVRDLMGNPVVGLPQIGAAPIYVIARTGGLP